MQQKAHTSLGLRAARAPPDWRLLAGRMRAVAGGRATAVRRSDGLRRAAFCGAV
jgi:hypothetical protein